MNPTIRRIALILTGTAVAVSLLGCAGGEAAGVYRSGKSALSHGRYAEAAEAFSALEEYRDSEAYLERIFEYALTAYEDGRYEEAAEIFSALEPTDSENAAVYAALARAQIRLTEQDAAGAYGELEAVADADCPDLTAFLTELDALCFPDTVLLRPEAVVPELKDGRVEFSVSMLPSDGDMEEYLYTMPKNSADSAYRQYGDYCAKVFPGSFAQADSYFSFQIQGSTYYVCNYYALYSGLVIRIPRY